MKVFVLSVTDYNYAQGSQILGVFSTAANAISAALRSDFMRDIIKDIDASDHALLVQYASGVISEDPDTQKQLYELLCYFHVDESMAKPKYFEIEAKELDDLYY
jgi:hypothetical protein